MDIELEDADAEGRDLPHRVDDQAGDRRRDPDADGRGKLRLTDPVSRFIPEFKDHEGRDG